MTALSEKMPILPRLKHAFRVAAVQTPGHCRVLPTDNAFHGKSIVRYADVTAYSEKACDTNFWLSGRRGRAAALAPVRRSNRTCSFPASGFHKGTSST